MTTHGDIIQRWVNVQLGTTTKRLLNNGGNVIATADALFSYGNWFELARPLRNPRTGKVNGWLTNGERRSNSTTRHQSTVLSVLTSTDLPIVTIPHQALEAAGIDFDSVRLIHRLDDRWDPTIRYDPPEGWHSTDYPVYPTKVIDTYWGGQHHTYGVPDNTAPPIGTRTVWYDKGGSSWEVTDLPDGRTEYRQEYGRHWMGESLITANVVWKQWVVCRSKDVHAHQWTTPREERCPRCGGGGGRTVRRSRRATFLSGFDHQESPPAYFFCELPPGTHPDTVAAAYQALKPDAVQLAEQMGRKVIRQGDIFAVPLSLSTRDLTRQGAQRQKKAYILGTNHRATEVAMLPDGTTLVRGTLTHAPQWRRPDHKRVTVGKAWAIAVKNTVPVTV